MTSDIKDATTPERATRIAQFPDHERTRRLEAMTALATPDDLCDRNGAASNIRRSRRLRSQRTTRVRTWTPYPKPRPALKNQ